MKIKTKSGVSITIIPEGSSRIMLFSKPIRAIELKEAESSQLSALLTSDLDTKANTESKIRLMREPKAISQ